ncbi:MAG TPA: hypothetical protein VFA90_10480 [Terriglobales bacterium]|nr:hypothetical protein [Terriglobales bacterium]
MIEPGTSAIKRICAKAEKLFHTTDKACDFDLKRIGGSISAGAAQPAQIHFAAKDVHLLNSIRQQLSEELESEEPITDQDILYLALEELHLALRSSRREDETLRLQFQLWQDKVMKKD